MTSPLLRQGHALVRSAPLLRPVVTPSASSRSFASSVNRADAAASSSTSSTSAAPSSQPRARAQRPAITTPDAFVSAIARPRRGDLKSVLSALGGEGEQEGAQESLDALLSLKTDKLKEAGVPVKERRYFLWCLERFKQGQDPRDVSYDIKPKKKIRAWGPRVQNGKRVRGVKRKGER